MKEYLASRRRWTIGSAFIVLGLWGYSTATAQGDVGSFEGAVWRFGIEAKAGNPHKGSLRGHFRVADLKVYQAENPDDAEAKKLDKKVGESKPGPGKRPDTALLTLEDFQAWGRAGKKFTLSGTCRLRKGEKPGEVFGDFVDKEGYHWELKAKRVQE